MAPPVSVPKASIKQENGVARLGSVPRSREVTPTNKKEDVRLGPMTKSDTELASLFKSDLTDIKGLVTCTICDQLLYEPWTLLCGHTYCYSCLCSWFLPNKHKKTCPECRTAIKQMPAPAFLVKQMVDIFTKRIELMPSDESKEQHQKRRVEETEAVERDKRSAEGLFKGTFPNTKELFYDESDGVSRCPVCHHEYEGGELCNNCGAEVEPEQYFSEMGDESAYDESDIEIMEEVGADRIWHYHSHRHHGHPGFMPHHGPPYHFHAGFSDYDSEGNDSENDSEGSLREFVEEDESSPQQPSNASMRRAPIILSDDESDEGGEVSNRIRRRRRAVGSSSPSVITVDSSDNDEAILQRNGWSPLHGDPDDEDDEDEDDDGSTETMVGGGENGDQDGDDLSDTPGYEYRPVNEVPGYDDIDRDTEMTEMSSPMSSRSVSVDTEGENAYGWPSRQTESPMDEVEPGAYGYSHPTRDSLTPSSSGYGYDMGEDHDTTDQFDAENSSSSDEPIHPVNRRRERQRQQQLCITDQQQYDPRISLVFAEHQQSMRGAQNYVQPDPGDGTHGEAASGSRVRRSRVRQPRTRRGQSPPTVSSSRGSRVPAAYQTRRGF